MADRKSAGIFAEVFAALVEEFHDGDIRRSIALRMWRLSRNYDFSDYQMEADDVLIELGLARRIPNTKHPDEGDLIEYGPVADT